MFQTFRDGVFAWVTRSASGAPRALRVGLLTLFQILSTSTVLSAPIMWLFQRLCAKDIPTLFLVMVTIGGAISPKSARGACLPHRLCANGIPILYLVMVTIWGVIEAAIQDEHARVCREAAIALGKLGEHAGSAVPALGAALRSQADSRSSRQSWWACRPRNARAGLCLAKQEPKAPQGCSICSRQTG